MHNLHASCNTMIYTCTQKKWLKSRDKIDHFQKVMEEYSKYAYICTGQKHQNSQCITMSGLCLQSSAKLCTASGLSPSSRQTVPHTHTHTHTRRPATAKLLSPTAICVRETSTWTDLSRCRINLRDRVVYSLLTKTTKVIIRVNSRT